MTLMAGFEWTQSGTVSKGIRAGRKFVPAPEQVPAGPRHAVRGEDEVALCGKNVIVQWGEWAEKRGMGAYQDCPTCAGLAPR